MKRILISLGFVLLAPFSVIADVDEFLSNVNRNKLDYQECHRLFHAQNFFEEGVRFQNWRELVEVIDGTGSGANPSAVAEPLLTRCRPFLSADNLSWTAPPLNSSSSTTLQSNNSQSKSNTPSTLKAKLLELRTLVDDGLITEEDYEQAKKQMLDNM